MLKLTRENYFSLAANREYMSNSQYKRFCGCEALKMAEINGVWEEKPTNPMVQGKYVHAYYEGDGAMDRFKAENPSVVKGDNNFYATFKVTDLDDVIRVINEDALFLRSLEGEKEVIFTASLFGLEWKILIDAYNPGHKRFDDLKILKSLSDKFWNKEAGYYENVFDYRGYFTQVAIYAEIERLANGRPEGDYFEPFISIATKEKYPDKVIVSFASDELTFQEFITQQLLYVESNIDHIKDVKNGKIEPYRCEACDYCKSTKKLTQTQHYTYFNLY